MVYMQWKGRSLMCTSNVAGNTQMASLDRQVTQNGLGVNNAIARGIYNGVVEVTILAYGRGVKMMKWYMSMTTTWR